MTKTIVGLFDEYRDAQAAVNDLEAMGLGQNEISIVANEATTKAYRESTGTHGGGGVGGAVGGAVSGAVEGGVIGGLTGLAASLALLAIPGIGPVLAIGPVAATLTGAGLGAAGGGVLGALTGYGVPEEDAHLYTEGIRRGGTLVTVHTDENLAERAAEILRRHNPVDITRRGTYYRENGYTGYDPNTAPYTASDIETYRSSNPQQYGAGIGSTASTGVRVHDRTGI